MRSPTSTHAPEPSEDKTRRSSVGSEEDLELAIPTSVQTYDVTFPHETKLGMLLERIDQWDETENKSKERTLVKMVVEGGAAEVRGVVVGSKIYSLNGENVVGKPYNQTLDMVKMLPRPLRVTFEYAGNYHDMSQGEILLKKDIGYHPPSAITSWKPVFYVIGGAVARENVLQLYQSKSEYESVVVNLFQDKTVKDFNFKAYRLDLSFRCGPVQIKEYPGRKSLSWFWIKNPQSKTKVLKVASENSSVITALHNQVAKHVSS